MSTESRLLPAVAIAGSSILVGCGGGGYSGSSCGSYGSYGSYGSFAAAGRRARSARATRGTHGAGTAPASGLYAGCLAPGNAAAGIYEGTLTNEATQQMTPVVAIIAEDGDGAMSGQDGTYYRLSVGTGGYDVSGSFAGYSQASSLPDGSHSTSGSVTGQLSTAGLDGTLTYQTGSLAALSLNFDNTYDLASTLPALAGSWSYSANGFSLTATIQSDGTFSATDSNSCSYNGAFGLIDPAFDVYSENFVRTCNGTSTTFTGLASYFPATAAAAARIKLLADDHSGDYLAADLR